ncbi:hypothetical protein QK289_04145 [Exiguobacterium antarcticum]|uniref:Uncharacterized protein n=1 Tax=Exiguobacterium antarcticum TaxID=132920 RepID=A0ABT6QZS7_9BACL|nr:hypothetical protein [Exiguobacterium antarcticum]MDI3234189.1 hypothetical protein [Exiguobacterium antarcticum]
MQEQSEDSLGKRFVEAIKAILGRIKRMVGQAMAWLLDKLGKRAQATMTSPMRRTLDTKWNRTWDKVRLMHPHATLIAMKKRSRTHRDQRMMKRARSTLKS